MSHSTQLTSSATVTLVREAMQQLLETTKAQRDDKFSKMTETPESLCYWVQYSAPSLWKLQMAYERTRELVEQLTYVSDYDENETVVLLKGVRDGCLALVVARKKPDTNPLVQERQGIERYVHGVFAAMLIRVLHAIEVDTVSIKSAAVLRY